MLINNYYTNTNSMHICFAMKIKQKSDEDHDIDADLITVNNCFAHLVKEKSVTGYGNDKQLMPTFSPYLIQFVAWACNGCSTAPLPDYINNPVYQ